MVATDLLGEPNDDQMKIILPEQHENDTHSNLSARFKEQNVDFKNQYCKIYSVRLEKMFQLLQRRIVKKWGEKYPVVKVHKLQEESDSTCIIIGTLFKDQKLKPSILRKISEHNSLIPQPIYTHFTDDSDQLFIEDDLQRYEVVGNIDTHKLVTGISCALLGRDLGKGKFLVEDFTFASCQPQVERPIDVPDRYVCFLSGLDLVNYEKVTGSLKLCVDYVMGFMGDDEIVSKISRVVVAGNSVRCEDEVKKLVSMEAKATVSNDTLEAVKKLDIVVSQFSRLMNVDVMPGKYDPSNHLLAQQAMHRCIFPLSKRYEKFSSVSNPYEFVVDGIRILGSSGQPVSDILGYSTIEKPIEALEKCLIWSHISPTAPDTLACYPYYETDPFVIEECPHVFFAGNQSEFDTKIYEGPEGQRVRLICIPEFSKTASIVLLNLRTLECHDMNFECYDI